MTKYYKLYADADSLFVHYLHEGVWGGDAWIETEIEFDVLEACMHADDIVLLLPLHIDNDSAQSIADEVAQYLDDVDEIAAYYDLPPHIEHQQLYS